MLKVDIHTHILPRNLSDFSKKHPSHHFIHLEHHAPGCAHMIKDGALFREVKANCWDIHVRRQECIADAVDVQVLSTVPVMFNYHNEAKTTHLLAQYLNDDIAHQVTLAPKHFVGLGTLPLQSPDLAIDELTRCMQDLNLAGVQIGSHVNGWNLNAPELFPVFEAAEALGAAIFVHPWDMMGKEQMPDYWLPWLVGMPAETARAICSLIFGGVIERLPDLRIAFAHGGGSFIPTLGRIEHGFKVRPDLCATHISKPPSYYLQQLVFDSLVHDAAMLKLLIDTVGSQRIALGSDYPFPLGEHHPGHLIQQLSLSVAQQEDLLYGTALKWLNLSTESFL